MSEHYYRVNILFLCDQVLKDQRLYLTGEVKDALEELVGEKGVGELPQESLQQDGS